MCGEQKPLFIEVCVLWMRVNLNKIFASVEWAEMSLNEMKWAKMSEGPIYMRVKTSLATLASLSFNIYYK